MPPQTDRAVAVFLAWFWILLALSPRESSAQDDPAALAAREATLRGRLTADASDTASRCDLGFVLVRLGRVADAVPELDRAIHELDTSTTPTLHRRLAACLYNRGRAAEALGDIEGARLVYRRSLTIRPNATVRAHLEALPAADPVAAARAVALHWCSGIPDRGGCASIDAATQTVDDLHGTVWVLVAVSSATTSGYSLGAHPCRQDFVVAVHDDTPTLGQLYSYCGDGAHTVRMHARAQRLGAVRFGVVIERTVVWREEARSGGSAYDASDDAIDVMWWAGSTVASAEVPTVVRTPDDTYVLAADIGEDGVVVVRRVSGEPSPNALAVIGTHTLDELAEQ